MLNKINEGDILINKFGTIIKVLSRLDSVVLVQCVNRDKNTHWVAEELLLDSFKPANELDKLIYD